MVMLTGFDWTGSLFLALAGVVVYILGWAGGMLHMRQNYLRIIKADMLEMRRMTRWAERREKEARTNGYVVGYREGSRAYPNGMERE